MQGCFAVPMVHSTYLLDLRRTVSQDLAFYPPHTQYPYYIDDIMAFAFSAEQAGQTNTTTLCFIMWQHTQSFSKYHVQSCMLTNTHE